MTEVQAYYEPGTGVIRITGDVTCAVAGLPPEMQALFRHVLRHEYGHALADDWREVNGLPAEPFLTYSDSGQSMRAAAFPDSISPVVAEFAEVSPNIYGPDYLTQNFDEYFAESYARFLDGKEVPPRTECFLRGLAAE